MKLDPEVAKLFANQAEWEAPRRAAFEQARDELVVTARITCSAYPMQIVGTVDGRSFYLRERWGEFNLWLAGPTNPMVFVKDDFGFDGAEVIVSGDEQELYGEGDEHYAKPLRTAVAAIREVLGTAM